MTEIYGIDLEFWLNVKHQAAFGVENECLLRHRMLRKIPTRKSGKKNIFGVIHTRLSENLVINNIVCILSRSNQNLTAR